MTTKQKSKPRAREVKQKAPKQQSTAIQTKRKREPKQKLTPEQRAQIVDWLKSNDKRLYGARAWLRVATIEVRTSLKLDVSTRTISSIATEHCKFWRNPEWKGGSRPSKQNELTCHQWEALQKFVRAMFNGEKDLRFDPRADDVTLDFIVRVCRLRAQLKANRQILLNCSVFQKLARGLACQK